MSEVREYSKKNGSKQDLNMGRNQTKFHFDLIIILKII
jgi:hypothetical protein